ncbi:hypothetical protein Tco_0725158 [Tanacetum coccineum]|uniref:Reverse transcriptase domain-containing protein n=1 Tax=Tanacetum coccineum TaxID=301880 RepID=A0ABQ4YE74_9ASTR
MVAARHAQFNTTKGGDLLDASVNTLTNKGVSNPLEDVKDTMPVDQNKLQPEKDEAVENAVKSSFVDVANSEPLIDVEGSDFVLPIATITVIQHKYENYLVGYCVGKSVAFPLVQNYVTNTWGKYGFQKVMRDEDGFFFFFKFASKTRLEQVLEQGPWMIRNNHIILTKWAPNMSLTKDIVTKVPIWVKMHKVPIVAYSEDGISLIATQIGKPIMLDAFTSAMCADSWGRLGFARALIEVSAETELKKEVIMAVPMVEDTGYTKERIQVEYEWTPPLCLKCHVFGHSIEQCPKCVIEPTKATTDAQEDGFTTVQNRKKKGKAKENSNARQYEGLKLNKPKSTFVYRQKQPAKATNKDEINIIKLKNHFDALHDQEDLIKECDVGESRRQNGSTGIHVDPEPNSLDSDSKVEEVYAESVTNVVKSKGASTPSSDGLDVYVCAILESHVDIQALSKVCSKVFRCWDWTSNASLYAKGCRIILGWNVDVVDMMVISQSSQAMHVKLLHKDTKQIIFCLFIYATNLPIERRHLWSDLGHHKHVVRGLPWVLMGDFNVVLNMEDCYFGSSCFNSAMLDFKDCVSNIEVMDINSSGLHFTWNQKPKGGGGLLKKLDRIMGNIEFLDSFPGDFALFQPYRILDHSPAVLKISSLTFNKPKPFKFFNFLTFKSNFLDLVNNSWNVNVDGHYMYQVVSKLKLLKKPIRKLLHDHGNLHERVNKLRFELDEVQKALDLNPADGNLREEEAIYVQAFNDAKLDEEQFLKQKAKIEWLEVEGLNLQCANDFKCFSPLIHEMFLGTSMDVINIEGLFQKKVSDASFIDMVRPVFDVEIRGVMFDIGDDRAPGPDGYTSAFFKKSWDIVGVDVCNAVRDFFSNGKILKEINHTFITLIPKVSTPIKINDFRPISCCNVIYKCIRKIITNRIIEGIKEVVSDNQSAFVPGRRISDNILITQELMHNYHRDRGPLDVRLSLNGDIHGFFKGKRGLRQGDPLSPYLFTLVMEVLTLMLKRRVRLSESFRYHNHCEELQIINVCFADDLFIFARGDVESASVIMEALHEFKSTSGLVPSIPKSTAFFCNVLNHVKMAILNIMPFSEGELPIKYLGFPLISSRLLNRDCKVLFEKDKNRISDWKNKSLSFAGRLQLCKSVISSMHVYWTSVLIIPKGIILDIQQLIRGFFWCNGEYKHGKAKGSSFWHVPLKADMSWGWLKLLQLRDLVRPFIWMKVGNGNTTSVWFDIWDYYCPLIKFLSPRDITREGFNLLNHVSGLVSNNEWMWPQAWLLKAPNLGTITAPILDANSHDVPCWRDISGNMSEFLIKRAWEVFRPRGNEVAWYRMVWFSHCIPRHAFHLWLAMQNNLRTQDKLRQWDVGINVDLNLLRCPLCDIQPDSHDHLFFECNFSKQVWMYIRHLADMDVVPPTLTHITSHLQPLAKKRTAKSILGRLLLAASSYYVWLERNNRLFKKARRSPKELRDIIMVTVRLKLITFRFKNTSNVNHLLERWKMPSTFRLYGG